MTADLNNRNMTRERQPQRQKEAATILLIAGLLTALAFAPVLIGKSPAQSAGQSKGRRSAPPAVKTAQPEALIDFKQAERLGFQVLFSKFTVKAGEVEFNVVERRQFFGRPAWHFRATAQSVDTVRLVYPLNDQFDSYTDAARLTSLQYEMYLREPSGKQDMTWRMDTGEQAIPSGVSAARVVPGTRDPLGLLYALRATDWKRTPQLRTPVFDGHHLYEVEAQAEADSSAIKVPAGAFNATRIGVRVFERGREVRDTTFSVWLADDEARTPVLVEASLPIGSARIELTSRQ